MIWTDWLKYWNNKVWLVSGALFCVVNLHAQTLEEYLKKYPNYAEIILRQDQTYDFSLEKNKLKVFQDNYQESMILTDAGVHHNKESFTYSELVPCTGFEGYTLNTVKNKQNKIPISKVSEESAGSRSVFHDDVKQKNLTFTNLEVGSKKVYSYQYEFKDPFLLHHFAFKSYLPQEKTSFTVLVDKDIEIGYKIFNDEYEEIKLTKTEKKGKVQYVWECSDVSPLRMDGKSPGARHIMPHIVVFVKNYRVAGKLIPVLGDTKLLFAYYQDFVKNLNKEDDQELKSITQKLVAPFQSDEEKIKAIFYWVKDNIKYIAFEAGYEGFVPRQAKLVCERKFGDCKDMASIITDMARYASVPNVNLCWIGTRSIPYTYSALSTPAVDNHMIAAYETNGKTIFLDATDSKTRYGLPSSFIQGKEALIKNGNDFKIVVVPTVPSADNLIQEDIQLKLEDAILAGKGTQTIHGLSRTDAIYAVGDANGKARTERIKSKVGKGNNKFQLNNYKEENLSDRDKPYIIGYDFNLENYVVKAGDEVYVNLFLNQFFYQANLEKDRKSPYENDILQQYRINVSLDIPQGMNLKYLPGNEAFDNEIFGYKADYKAKGNNVTLSFFIESKKLLVMPSDFDAFNLVIDKLKELYNNSIILTTK